MDINLNENVEVELTEYGMKVFRDYVDQFGIDQVAWSVKQTFQLWELMQIFGEVLYNGNPKIPFVNNKITYKG